MDISDLAVPAASAATGVLSTGWIAKVLITSWLEKYDKALETLRDVDKSTAVMASQIKTLQKDLDGVADMVRSKTKTP